MFYYDYLSAPGLYTNVDMFDFGTLRTMGMFDICLHVDKFLSFYGREGCFNTVIS